MTRRPKGPRKRGGGDRAPRPAPMPVELGTRAVAAALRIAAADGWSSATLDRIAAEAGITLEELQDMFATRAALLEAFIADIDHDMLGRVEEGDSSDSPRDRLFNVIMARYDALRPYRDALVSIVYGALRDAPTAWVLACTMRRSLAWILAAAGISHVGFDGELRMQGAGAVLLATFWTWAHDDSEDMSPTMASVDRALRNAERLGGWMRMPRATQRKGRARP